MKAISPPRRLGRPAGSTTTMTMTVLACPSLDGMATLLMGSSRQIYAGAALHQGLSAQGILHRFEKCLDGRILSSVRSHEPHHHPTIAMAPPRFQRIARSGQTN